jgi:hypothetical protein
MMALSEPSVDISELSNYLASIGYFHVDLVLIPPQALFHYTDLYGLIPTFKNAAFREESEWRLLFTPSPSTPVKPRFRVSRNMLTPFYSRREITGVALPQLPIHQVHVRPSVNKRLNRENVKALFSQNGYPAAEVLVSATPFRL